MFKILLVDDDGQSLESTRKILELAHYEVVTATDGQAALDLIRPSLNRSAAHRFDLVVTDVRMPRLGGLEFLRALSLCGDTCPVVLMTAFGRVQDAVWAMKLGAVDFLTKPFKRQQLLSSVEAALKRSIQVSQVSGIHGSSATPGKTEGQESSLRKMRGSSKQLEDVKKCILQVAPTAVTVLISGESGTGKELAARAIHELSARAARPLIALNCAALPENLMESELFGYEKGAFTGATQSKAGLFEAADGGTLLLDEIGDMPLSLQAKLLRVLQEGEVRRIGATVSRKIDVRLIGATHRDLRLGVEQGRFREDLLYRLEVVKIQMPALRDRVADLTELVNDFLERFSLRHGKSIHKISEHALSLLLQHPWPGNIRELSNVIERAVIFCQTEQIGLQDLPDSVVALAMKGQTTRGVSGAQSIEVPLGTSLKEVEDLLIRRTLEATAGDKNMTAKLLGINQRTIYRKLAETKEADCEEQS